MKRRFRTSLFALCGSALALLAARQPASALDLYATSITTGIIYKVDTVTHAVTPFFNTGADLDSLIFDKNGRIVYSQLGNGRVKVYDPITHSNTTLATGLSGPIDLALEPSQTSFLVSNSTSNSLSRVSLAGGILGSAMPMGGRPDGIIYDNANRLFANVSTGFTANNSHVKRLDPLTGATLAQSADMGVFLDGLTFDSYTGRLYASDYNNRRIVKIDPNTLAFSFLTPTGAALSDPDGITTDNAGNLYIASRGNSHVVQYNLATNAAIVLATIAGLDDLAPAAGLGAPVPEPDAMLLLMGAGSAGSFIVLSRRHRK